MEGGSKETTGSGGEDVSEGEDARGEGGVSLWEEGRGGGGEGREREVTGQ